MAFLDKNGLAHFWEKVKEYMNERILKGEVTMDDVNTAIEEAVTGAMREAY